MKSFIIVRWPLTEQEVKGEEHQYNQVNRVPDPAWAHIEGNAMEGLSDETLLVDSREAEIADEHEHPDVKHGLPATFLADDELVLDLVPK